MPRGFTRNVLDLARRSPGGIIRYREAKEVWTNLQGRREARLNAVGSAITQVFNKHFLPVFQLDAGGCEERCPGFWVLKERAADNEVHANEDSAELLRFRMQWECDQYGRSVRERTAESPLEDALRASEFRLELERSGMRFTVTHPIRMQRMSQVVPGRNGEREDGV